MDEIGPQHEVTARKPHRCSWCGKEILPGEKFVTSTLKTDYIYEWRECDRCKPYVDEMFDDDVWGDYDPVVDIDKHYCLVTLANNDEALSITKESLIKLLSLIGCE